MKGALQFIFFVLRKFPHFLLFIIRLILTFCKPVSDKFLHVLCWIRYGGTKPLPFIDSRILVMSATELAQKIRKKELSAEEVMTTYITRIKNIQPIINACVDYRFEEAIADAKAVDRMIEADIKTEKEMAETLPLLGVPFTCKEIIGVKGLAQTFGVKQFKDRKALEDSEAAARYRKAGAIPIVVTNIPTFALWCDTSNPVFGRTKNPYNNHRICGGSSGGEAALISAAGAVIGIGNDLGGSIRLPSSFCGIYGHKPSAGISDNKTLHPDVPDTSDAARKINQYFNVGPMCRYAEDLNLLVKVLAGPNSRRLHLNEKVDFSDVNIYYMEQFPGCLLSTTSDIKAGINNAVRYFENQYDVTARKLELKELKYSFEIWMSKLFEASGPFVRGIIADKNGKLNLFWEYLKCIFGFSEYDFRVIYFASIELQKKDKFYYHCLDLYKVLEEKISEILDGNSILILPVFPEPPPYSIETIPKFKNVAYTCIFNILGLPGTAIPMRLSNGVPIGLQVLAKKNNDHLTIATALELDKVFGGWRNPCPILV